MEKDDVITKRGWGAVGAVFVVGERFKSCKGAICWEYAGEGNWEYCSLPGGCGEIVCDNCGFNICGSCENEDIDGVSPS